MKNGDTEGDEDPGKKKIYKIWAGCAGDTVLPDGDFEQQQGGNCYKKFTTVRWELWYT